MTRRTVQAFKSTLAQAWVSTFSMADDDAHLYLLMRGRAINTAVRSEPSPLGSGNGTFSAYAGRQLGLRAALHADLPVDHQSRCRAHATRSIRPA
jgi:hypothetical protein